MVLEASEVQAARPRLHLAQVGVLGRRSLAAQALKKQADGGAQSPARSPRYACTGSPPERSSGRRGAGGSPQAATARDSTEARGPAGSCYRTGG